MRWILAVSLISSLAGADPLPEHYASLFERGKTWVYDTSLQYFGGETDPRTGKSLRHTDRDKVTCKVADVTKRANISIAHITCDKDFGRKFEVGGYWLGTAAGLWRFAETESAPDADGIREIQKAPARILGKPVVFEKVQRVQVLEPKHDTVTTGVRESPKIHGWCAYEDSSNADPDGGRVVMCFGPGIGIQSGYDDIGGDLNKFEFTAR